MEYIVLGIATFLIVSIILYNLLDGYNYSKFKNNLHEGTCLKNNFIKLFDPYYENGFDTCTILKVSDEFALVRFNDDKQTEISVPILYFYKNCWEKI